MRLTIANGYSRQQNEICILDRDAIILHDNAWSHTGILTRNKLDEIGWETLKQPSYNLNLYTCDYIFFPHLKKSLGRERLENNQEVEKHIRKLFKIKEYSGFQICGKSV